MLEKKVWSRPGRKQKSEISSTRVWLMPMTTHRLGTIMILTKDFSHYSE